ncbi:hypothetical protein M438DRAFT_351531 [Aureobasidium pullulans EXF-150]|uniref:Rhodopsin domain-containing protein n=1 Tax=Aureobasidium pullulans EXF-150 TaxID=1043002 RepID=A0A074XRJ6_AURPU|nr:uncharacterized protein M438DRAFT_351531 [Aureobasidium pullulans EXF-150]KEQ88238.1 hypothetical protein M438DRAFT_351531 [Aureobasidium pullulans EXF-150]
MVWVKHASDQVDQESRWRTIVAVSMATTVIAFAMVVGRVWPRRWSMKAEEWIISTTLVFSVIYKILCVLQTRYGLGLPPNLRPLEDKAMLTKLSYVGKPFYQFGIAGFKLSLCLTFLRLTKYTGLLQKNFHSSHPGRCLPFAAVNYPMASITILFDILIFAMLPYLLFRNLQLEQRRKATLYISFALGLLTTVFSIIRITYFPVVSTKGDNSDVVMYGTLEFKFGIATSCVPFVRAQLPSARSVRQTPKGYKTHVTGPDPAIELKDVCKSDSDSQKGLVEENASIRSTHTIVHRSTNSGTSPPYGKVMGWS